MVLLWPTDGYDLFIPFKNVKQMLWIINNNRKHNLFRLIKSSNFIYSRAVIPYGLKPFWVYSRNYQPVSIRYLSLAMSTNQKFSQTLIVDWLAVLVALALHMRLSHLSTY